MKKFNEFLTEAGFPYRASIDGPPLNPHTISGAENQIRELARQIRTTFGIDERWRVHKPQIVQACSILDKAADIIGSNMSDEERMLPHKFHGAYEK